MRWTRSVLLACALVCGGRLDGQSLPDSSRTPAVDDEPRHVSGHVIDDLTGKPVGGAKVQLAIVVMHSTCGNCPHAARKPEEPPPPREVRSEDDGSFAFDNVPPRLINITATKDGYITSLPIRRRADDTFGNYQAVNGSVQAIVIRLAPGATISGVLRHHDGSPVTVEPQIALIGVRSWSGFKRVEYIGWPKYRENGVYRYDGYYPGCYYLIATPRSTKGPARMEGGRAFGEVPVRYPAVSQKSPHPCFRLREGEHLAIDLTLPEKELHRVTTLPGPISILGINILDDSGSCYNFHDLPREPKYETWLPDVRYPGASGVYYSFHQLYFDPRYEAWLPDGRYWLDNGRPGEISGPVPFTVNGADLKDLEFTIWPTDSTSRKVPVEVNAPSQHGTDLGKTGPCGFVNAKLIRFDRNGYVDVDDSFLFVLGEHCGEQRPVTASMAPGEYTLVISTSWLNYYVKSIRSGGVELTNGPLIVRRGEIPEPIKIELAKGGTVKGSLQYEGKPARGWVYTIAQETTAKTDFRLFEPVFAKDDGTFVITGLAPGPYLVFASDLELELDRAKVAASQFWRAHGVRVEVAADETTEVELAALDPPDEP